MNQTAKLKEKTDTVKNVTIYLPNSWEKYLLEKLEKYPPDFNYVHIDYFKYIGQLPYHIASKVKGRDFYQGFVPVNKAKLAQRIHNYRQYLDYLVKHKFLEEDKYYEVGEFSGGLRYPTKYLRQGIVKTALRRPTLVKSILSKPKGEVSLEATILLEDLLPMEYPYLTKWIPGLGIDEKKAQKILKEVIEKERLNPEKYRPKQKWKERRWNTRRRNQKKDDYDFIEFRHKLRCLIVKQISYGDHLNAGADKNVGRFHSFLTRLKKELRRAVTYKGKKLVSIDIVNSQPYLMVGLLDPTVFTNNTLFTKIFRYNPTLIRNISQYFKNEERSRNVSAEKITYEQPNNTYNQSIYISYSTEEVDKGYKVKEAVEVLISTTMIVNYLLQVSENQDVVKYISWVTSGCFYERFGEELVAYKLIPKDCSDPRKRAKEITLTILFGKNDSKKKVKKAVRAFRKVFPTVFEITEMVKFGDSADHTHSTLACTLQSFESDTILKHCCGTLAAEYPDLPLFTIHDSIITTEGNEHIVKEVMIKEFKNVIGYVPQFKVEHWV